jgi:hypothetical protein
LLNSLQLLFKLLIFGDEAVVLLSQLVVHFVDVVVILFEELDATTEVVNLWVVGRLGLAAYK